MTQKINYNHTLYACFSAYIVQAIVNNFAPLLFLTFQTSYDIPLPQITMLVTFNFIIQLAVDLLSAFFADKAGYRMCIVFAHMCAAAGLVCLSVLPDLMANAFQGLLISVFLYAVGGGLIEVLISPVVESCPTKNKEKAMSLLHSFYCWGHVGVVLLSTLFFSLFGIKNWHFLAFFWAAFTLTNGFFFLRVPMSGPAEGNDTGLSFRKLFSDRLFLLFLIMMVCAGASEQAVSQWSSALAEKGLGISKTTGDLVGPMMFAASMGTSRFFYGKFGHKINLDRFMKINCLLCILSYLWIALVPMPLISLLGCSLCGLSVGIMWPGTFSKAASALKNGGTSMFAFLALAGDLGCSAGPTFVGIISGHFHDNLKIGIGCAIFIPLILLLSVLRAEKTAKA